MIYKTLSIENYTIYKPIMISPVCLDTCSFVHIPNPYRLVLRY